MELLFGYHQYGFSYSTSPYLHFNNLEYKIVIFEWAVTNSLENPQVVFVWVLPQNICIKNSWCIWTDGRRGEWEPSIIDRILAKENWGKGHRLRTNTKMERRERWSKPGRGGLKRMKVEVLITQWQWVAGICISLSSALACAREERRRRQRRSGWRRRGKPLSLLSLSLISGSSGAAFQECLIFKSLISAPAF